MSRGLRGQGHMAGVRALTSELGLFISCIHGHPWSSMAHLSKHMVVSAQVPLSYTLVFFATHADTQTLRESRDRDRETERQRDRDNERK